MKKTYLVYSNPVLIPLNDVKMSACGTGTAALGSMSLGAMCTGGNSNVGGNTCLTGGSQASTNNTIWECTAGQMAATPGKWGWCSVGVGNANTAALDCQTGSAAGFTSCSMGISVV